VLATMMLPFAVIMVPLFIIFKNFGWVGTALPLWVPTFTGSAFFIFLLRQFFLSIPQELSDAARIDGASEIDVFARIMLPLVRPAIAVIALFQFIGAYNDFLGPLLFLNDKSQYTIALGLNLMRNAYGLSDFGLIMAASFITILPVVVIFFLAQKQFIQGITFGGVKG